MALIYCVECNAKISDKAPQCPYCGCPTSFQTQSESKHAEENEVIIDPKWEEILQIIKDNSRSGFEAIDEIKCLTGVKLGEAIEIFEYMEKNGAPPPEILVPKQPPKTTVECAVCNNQISIKAETCPHCGNPTGVHVCPKCGSANTKTISSTSKATSVLLWGPFAANKVISKYQCKDCWHKF